MTTLTPKTSNFKTRVRENFNLQPMMKTLGVTLERVDAGQIAFTAPHHEPITQQHGFLHGGGVAAILDSACGYAAFSLLAEDEEILTVEFKTNFLAPALGASYRFEGTVLKPGRTLVITEGKAYAVDETGEKLVAIMTATMMPIKGRGDVKTVR